MNYIYVDVGGTCESSEIWNNADGVIIRYIDEQEIPIYTKQIKDYFGSRPIPIFSVPKTENTVECSVSIFKQIIESIPTR